MSLDTRLTRLEADLAGRGWPYVAALSDDARRTLQHALEADLAGRELTAEEARISGLFVTAVAERWPPERLTNL